MVVISQFCVDRLQYILSPECNLGSNTICWFKAIISFRMFLDAVQKFRSVRTSPSNLLWPLMLINWDDIQALLTSDSDETQELLQLCKGTKFERRGLDLTGRDCWTSGGGWNSIQSSFLCISLFLCDQNFATKQREFDKKSKIKIPHFTHPGSSRYGKFHTFFVTLP